MAVVRKLEEGDKLLQKATKAASSSLMGFNFKPDWETAAPLYGRAAQCYRQAGHLEKAMVAFERAAAANVSLGALWQAAKDVEAAADFASQKKVWGSAHRLYQKAFGLYMSGGRHTLGADCLAKGARAIEEHAPENAMAMLEQALDIYSTEEKGPQALDVYRQAIGTAILLQNYHQSAALQMSMAAQCSKCKARTSECMAYLGAVITYLFVCDGDAAWRCYQDALSVGMFACSEEGTTAQNIMDVYRSGDAVKIGRVVSSTQCLKFLDNSVARLAVRLPQGNVKEVAAALNKAAGGAPVPGGGGSAGGPSYTGSTLKYSLAGDSAAGGGGDEEEELL